MKRINIKGAIVSNDDQFVYDMFDMDSTSPNDVLKAIEEANGEDLEIIINSGGGSVFDASEIYTAIKEYPGKTTAKIVGLAASAASFLALAADTTLIAPTGQLMIHNASTASWGDYKEMDKVSEILKNTNKTISNAYQLKTGMSEDELLELMDKETWLSPQTAKEKGFVDEIMFENPNIKLSASVMNAIPQPVIDGLRNGLMDKKKDEGISKGELQNALESLKSDILNELKPKQNKEPDKEPEQKTNNLQRFFSNL